MIRWTRNPPPLVALLSLAMISTACPDSRPPPPPRPQAKDASPKAPEEEIVRLSDKAIVINEIRVEGATRHTVGESIDAPAEITLSPDRAAHVAPLLAGQLQTVSASIGDRVEAGQTLAVLRSVDLGQARAENQRAKAMLEAAEVNFRRQERLRAEGISSQKSFLEAQLRKAEALAERDASRARLLVFGLRGGRGPDMPITAPISGTIIARHATRGENVGPDDGLFVIADTARVWVVARVYEKDMSRVRVGANTRLTLQAQPGRSWEGKLGFVAPIVDEVTRTLAVRLELDNDDGSLRPGLFGHLRIAVGESAPVIAVPKDAVQTYRGAKVVFVPARAPNSFRPSPVTVGQHSGELVEIRAGLEAGSKFVVSGAFLLKSQLMAGEFGEEE